MARSAEKKGSEKVAKRREVKSAAPPLAVAFNKHTGSAALTLAVCVTVPMLLPGRLVPDGVLKLT